MEDEQKKVEGEEMEKETTKAEKPKKKKSSAKKKKKPAKKKTAKKKTTKKSSKKEKTEEEKPVSKAASTEKKEKPVTFTEKRKTKKRGGGFGYFVFFLAIALLIGGAFYRTQQLSEQTEDANNDLRQDVSTEVSFLKDKLQSLTNQLEEQKKAREEAKVETYTSPELNLTFEYSPDLGSASEAVTTQEGDEGVIEKHLMITFSANPDIWISAATSGYTDDTGLIYTGGEENLRVLCAEPLAISETGYCDYMNILDQESVEQVLVLGEDSITNIVSSIPANINAGEYTGLRVNVSLGLPPVTGRNLFAPTTDDQAENGLDEFLRNIIKKEGVSLVTMQNISAFEQVATTLSAVQQP